MTNEEAIFCEKSYIGETNCKDCKYYGLYTCKSRESHKMAIKALEQEACEDAISRDDALKALDYDIKSFEFKSGVGRHMNEIANLLNTIYEIQSDNIKALPSVTPQPYKANVEPQESEDKE